MAPYVFRWSSDSIYVPCISDFNLDSFWCKQDTTIRCLLKKKKVWFAVVVLRVHSFFICHLDVEFYLHSTTYLPPPPSHTTHSVGSQYHTDSMGKNGRPKNLKYPAKRWEQTPEALQEQMLFLIGTALRVSE